MSIAETTTRLRSCSAPSRNGWNIGGPACPRAPANQRSVAATNSGSRSAQVVVGHPAAAGDDVERELRRVLVHVVADVLEPLAARLGGSLGGLHHRPPLLPRRPVSAASRSGCSCRQATSARASSMASLVPEPMEKWAVWAASPSSTTLPSRQVAGADGGEGQPARVVPEQLRAAEQVGVQLRRSRRWRRWSFSPGARPGAAMAPNARCQTSLVHLDDHRAGRRCCTGSRAAGRLRAGSPGRRT